MMFVSFQHIMIIMIIIIIIKEIYGALSHDSLWRFKAYRYA